MRGGGREGDWTDEASETRAWPTYRPTDRPMTRLKDVTTAAAAAAEVTFHRVGGAAPAARDLTSRRLHCAQYRSAQAPAAPEEEGADITLIALPIPIVALSRLLFETFRYLFPEREGKRRKGRPSSVLRKIRRKRLFKDGRKQGRKEGRKEQSERQTAVWASVSLIFLTSVPSLGAALKTSHGSGPRTRTMRTSARCSVP